MQLQYCATHMNMKLPPDQLETRKGRDNVLRLIKTLFDNGGYHIQFNVLDTEKLRDAQKHPENYRDLVVRVAGFSAFFTQLACGRAERDHRTDPAALSSSIQAGPVRRDGWPRRTGRPLMSQNLKGHQDALKLHRKEGT